MHDSEDPPTFLHWMILIVLVAIVEMGFFCILSRELSRLSDTVMRFEKILKDPQLEWAMSMLEKGQLPDTSELYSCPDGLTSDECIENNERKRKKP